MADHWHATIAAAARPARDADDGFAAHALACILAVAVDEAASGTADLSATETGIVIARDGVYQQDGLRRESVSFATAPPFRASKEELQAAFARWAPLALFVGASFALGIFFAVLLADFLLAAAFHAFALWLALKLWKRPHSWKRTFVVMAYAATGPLVLQSLLAFAGTGLGQFSSLYYWGLTVWVLYAAVRTPSSGPNCRPWRPAGGRYGLRFSSSSSSS